MPRLIILALMWFSITGCFPKKAGTHLEHFSVESPSVGDRAPGFTLKSLDGSDVSLSSLIGSKPIVLQLASHTCPVYRYRRFSMSNEIRQAYGKAPSAAFVIDLNGRIALRQPWVDPKGIKATLDQLLIED